MALNDGEFSLQTGLNPETMINFHGVSHVMSVQI